MRRHLAILLIVLVCGTGPAAADQRAPALGLDRLFAWMDRARTDPEEKKRLGIYLRQVIGQAMAEDRQSGRPTICAAAGQGQFDAVDFWRYASARVPGPAAQSRMDAAVMVVQFVRHQNPCR